MSSSISMSGSNITYELQDGTTLFKNLQFSFGQKGYGLVGPNGVGKTTFLKLLSGDLQPTQGTLSIKGSLVVLPQIHHRVGVDSGQKTIEEILNIQKPLNAIKQIEMGNFSEEIADAVGDNWDLENRIQNCFHSLGIGYLSVHRPIYQLSGGELVKVYLARLLLESPTIALLDEPSNNLDSNGRKALYDFIKNWNKCMIVASHDRELLSHVQSIAELSKQGLQIYPGNYEFYLEELEKETQALEQKVTTAQQNQKKQKADLERSMERQQRRMVHGKRKASKGGIPKILMGGLKRNAENTLARVKNAQENRLFQSQLEVNRLRLQMKERNFIQIDIPDTSVHSKKEILEMKEFNFKYSDAGDFLFHRPITFQLVGPKRVRVVGRNGAGKSTLMKLWMQFVPSSKNEILGERIGIIQLKTNRVAYLDQNVEVLGDGNCSLLEQFSKLTPHFTETERRIRLGRFLFNQETTLKRISTLSGGEKMRAALACVLFSEVPPELLILDEPTNNLDIDSVERIESALSNFRGAIVVISHDSKFLETIGAFEELSLS